MNFMVADIMEIKRFAVHDGDGIRTTVFFKGCPLNCLWCHNPESKKTNFQLAFYSHKCINCHKCQDLCSVHSFENGYHTIDDKLCNLCGKCVDVCPKEALEIIGKKLSVDDILEIVKKDIPFFKESGGGVTLSGGECLQQADFCANLLKKAKELGINTAVDTCGFVPQSSIEKVLPYTDVFLYDIKAIDEKLHIKCTGQSNDLILKNLEYLSQKSIPTEIRIPFVPNYNDDQIEKIGNFLSGLDNIKSVKVLPYHNYCVSKYSAIGVPVTLPKEIPTKNDIENAKIILKHFGIICKD